MTSSWGSCEASRELPREVDAAESRKNIEVSYEINLALSSFVSAFICHCVQKPEGLTMRSDTPGFCLSILLDNKNYAPVELTSHFDESIADIGKGKPTPLHQGPVGQCQYPESTISVASKSSVQDYRWSDISLGQSLRYLNGLTHSITPLYHDWSISLVGINSYAWAGATICIRAIAEYFEENAAHSITTSRRRAKNWRSDNCSSFGHFLLLSILSNFNHLLPYIFMQMWNISCLCKQRIRHLLIRAKFQILSLYVSAQLINVCT